MLTFPLTVIIMHCHLIHDYCHVLRLLPICSSHIQIAWPLPGGAPYGYKSNNSQRSCMPLQPGEVLPVDASERAQLNWLVSGGQTLLTDFPSFEELARQADAGLF